MAAWMFLRHDQVRINPQLGNLSPLHRNGEGRGWGFPVFGNQGLKYQ
jgi:hypothetical protein